MSVDMTTKYLGLNLSGPIVAGAGPLTGHVDQLKALVDAGASALILPSLFEEQIEHEEMQYYRLNDYEADASAESTGFLPSLNHYNLGTRQYARLIEAAKRLTSIPVIASLNGYSSRGWARYSKMIAESGADALEMNIYLVPTDPEDDAADVERRYLDLVMEVRSAIQLPIAVKIGPYFSSLPNFAKRLSEAGADGLVLFNRYLEPELDVDNFRVQPHLELSRSGELRLPMRWIAILRQHFAGSLAATSGIHSGRDVLKALLVGADVTLMVSALLEKGPQHIQTCLREVEAWMVEHEYKSVEQLRGCMSRAHCENPSAYERANYLKALTSFTSEHPI
ncbi:dihydroorotate dehydrogenase-like protein [Blastopirellula sp. JC732]|uniref:Dihydroorotate dehydrogenase-like protein n=1 Tax=Blastopirellula sediminis TaxID=2894196 RepID=A0A9X1SF83_9BACT|nr:dihydroorotate dehydrogenase-like protein [Blastopirellula sediminis]MCC9608353.1 dihydroorotate dehydrogenase-like protein [Blastopirellula sediminis]MCC9628870.1 dihydroorotate dehydrogenase-like protein [Blastopirellula sediminis]